MLATKSRWKLTYYSLIVDLRQAAQASPRDRRIGLILFSLTFRQNSAVQTRGYFVGTFAFVNWSERSKSFKTIHFTRSFSFSWVTRTELPYIKKLVIIAFIKKARYHNLKSYAIDGLKLYFLAKIKWKGINCKQSTWWQHLSRLKASTFFSLHKILSCYETKQLILGTGTAIWWVTEPH